MQLSRILSACALNGVTVNKVRENYYVLTKGENRLTMHVQDDEVGYMTYHSPQTDAMTDCFCDSYYHTIKGAMHHLNPTGELVKAQKVERTVEPIVSNGSNDDGVVSRNMEKNGIEIRFPGKPSKEVIENLKGMGFRYSPFANVWWKRYNDADYERLMSKAVQVSKEPELLTV